MKPFTWFSVVLVIVAAGCNQQAGFTTDARSKVNPWTHLSPCNNPDNFQFAIVADRTGGHREGIFADAVEKLNLLNPEFVVCIGDLIEGYTEDKTELARQWNELDSLVDELEMPFFYLAGNHDISNETMAGVWKKRLGRSYYHFIYRNVLFLCLNTEDPPSSRISDRQVKYFRDVLKSNKNVRWTFVFMHKPIWKGRSIPGWRQLRPLLKDRPYTVFAGHEHHYQKYVINDRSYYVLATTGGVMEEDDKCRLDHIVWVTMTGTGPELANLVLDGIRDDEPCGN